MRSAAAVGRPAEFDQGAQHRRSMIAKIAVARKQLAMDEDDYRQGLFEQTGKTSLTQCSDSQLERVIGWLKSKGFRALPGKGAASHPMAMKARALWISLYHLGVVHNPAEAALEAFAKKQLGCDKLIWARQSDGRLLIEALKAWAARSGWPQHNRATQKPLDPLGLQAGLCAAILTRLRDGGHVPADWELHHAAWRLCGIENAREARWSAEDYERLAKALGAKLREMGGANGQGN